MEFDVSLSGTRGHYKLSSGRERKKETLSETLKPIKLLNDINALILTFFVCVEKSRFGRRSLRSVVTCDPEGGMKKKKERKGILTQRSFVRYRKSVSKSAALKREMTTPIFKADKEEIISQPK